MAIGVQAGAQTVPAKTKSLEEVVITAQKRRENPMKTPVAVTALSAASLKNKDVVSLESLAGVTPSFTVNLQGPTDGANIRGIGLSVSSPAVAPGVPIYRDGIMLSPLLAGEPFYDIQSVEVLRGPQGTLVGANSTGGAVFINTVSPKIGETGGYLEAKAGTYTDVGVQGALNMPINDELAARIAFNYETRDSFYTNVNTASHVSQTAQGTSNPGNLDQKDVRLGLYYKPSSQFNLLIKTNFHQDNNNGWALTPEAGTPAATAYGVSRPWQINFPDANTSFQAFQSRTSVEANYHFLNGITLRSVTGVAYTHELYNTQEFNGTASTPFGNHIEDHPYTQEFNLISPASAPVHWVMGTFSQYWSAAVKLTPNTFAPIDVTNHDDKVANAMFGDVGYNINPMFEVHGGLRYTLDHVIQTGGVYLDTGGHLRRLAPQGAEQHDGIWSGRLGANIKFSPNQFGYITVSRGAKTGGVNSPPGVAFAPEEVTDYEGGLKSTWLDGQLRTTLGGFYMDYNNLQLQLEQPFANTTPRGAIANAGASKIYGAEFTTEGHLGNWGFDGNLGYTHSSVNAGKLFNQYAFAASGQSLVMCGVVVSTGCSPAAAFAAYTQSVSGAPNPYSPTWSGAAGVEYMFDLGQYGTLTPRLNFDYSSVQWASVFMNTVDKMQARTLVGAHLTWERDTYTVTLYGTNLTNQYYITGNTANENFHGDPREIGVSLRKTF